MHAEDAFEEPGNILAVDPRARGHAFAAQSSLDWLSREA
jgi:hypothetical protein